MNKIIEQELLKLTKKAYKKDEVPVAAILANDNEIITKAYNTRYHDNNPINHAEIKCILKAAKKLNNWRLEDLELYVTLEPCPMCKSIIEEVRVKNVYFLVPSEKKNAKKTTYQQLNISINSECKNLLQSFFKNHR